MLNIFLSFSVSGELASTDDPVNIARDYSRMYDASALISNKRTQPTINFT